MLKQQLIMFFAEEPLWESQNYSYIGFGRSLDNL